MPPRLSPATPAARHSIDIMSSGKERGTSEFSGVLSRENKQKSFVSEKKKTKADLMNDFCKLMALLSGDLKRKFPLDQTCHSIHRKISVAVAHLPERILRAVGKYLVKYSERIMAADYEFFLKTTFKDDFPDDREMDEKEKLCLYTIELVKKHWNSLSDKEKKEYHGVVQNLLFCYCDFVDLEDAELENLKKH